MLTSNRFKPISTGQGELLPTFTSDLVPENHLARVVDEVVNSLDLTALYSKYSNEGGTTYHPKPLLKLLFYAYTTGERSSRCISKACRENVVYFYLGGGYQPDHRTISDFRKNNVDILKGLFKQIVMICYQLNMVSIGKISIDGTKIKAQASNSNIIDRDKLNDELNKVQQEISQILNDAETIDKQEDSRYGPNQTGEELPEKLQTSKQRREKIKELLSELDNEKTDKLNLSERDARFMRNHGHRDLCYNGQAATENQVILAYNLNNESADLDQLTPVITELENLATDLLDKKQHPLENVKVALDAGYNSGKNLQLLKRAKVDAYIANDLAKTQAKEKRGEIAPRPFAKDKFEYNAEEDFYQCPAGKKLVPVGKRKNKKISYTKNEIIYKGQSCHECSDQKHCTSSKTGYRQIKRCLEYDHQRELIDKKLKTEAGKAMLIHRFQDIEPTFGQIKQSTFRQNPFLLRGCNKAKGEFGLSCIVHNLKKIAKHIACANNSYNLNDIAKTMHTTA